METEWSVVKDLLYFLAMAFAGKRILWKLPKSLLLPYLMMITYRTLPDDRRKQRYWSVYAKGTSIDHWLRCIAGEEVPTTDGRVGRAGIELAEAVYRSQEQGKQVSLPL